MLYPLDENGYVINEASLALVQPEYLPAVEAIVGLLLQEFSTKLESIHIRGSVSVGRALPHLSDIDVVALSQEALSEEETRGLREKVINIGTDYSFIPFLDVTVLTKEQLTQTPTYSNLCVYLAVQSFCVWGRDMLSFLPRVKPGRKLALQMYGNIEQELVSLRNCIEGSEERSYLGSPQPVEFWCVWLMRVLLRGGMGIVMFRKPVFTQDLITCAEQLSALYPETQKHVAQALKYAIRPTGDREELVRFYDAYVPLFIKLWNENAYA